MSASALDQSSLSPSTRRRSAHRHRIDPLQTPMRENWWKVELVLLVFLVTGLISVYWMVGAYSPSSAGDSNLQLGMTQHDVKVILGEPNQVHQREQCWDYDRFHPGADRVCVQFDHRGKVIAITPTKR